ncbi:DUF4158 domain-containing protein [Streptomyces agglomeratus]|uniref:DUF4158 domain-containing protein n=1 Tax=Streptomyces agglomeratus TaxID=285458 RepID=UPI000A4B3091|nr:DUF4158 domain-containing protein [Streptomyces agglomeratus]
MSFLLLSWLLRCQHVPGKALRGGARSAPTQRVRLNPEAEPTRTDTHRLGMAVQICTDRYVGRFMDEDPLVVPWEAVEYLAGQLGIVDASCVKRYAERTRRVRAR